MELSKTGAMAGTRREGFRLLNLAILMIETGRLDQAEPLLRNALVIMERDAGSQHEWLPMTLNWQARLLLDQGHPGKAVVVAKRLDALLGRQFGAADFRTALSTVLSGRIQYAGGEREAGLETAWKAQRDLETCLGREDPYVLGAALDVAELQLQSGQWSQAQASLAVRQKANPCCAVRCRNAATCTAQTMPGPRRPCCIWASACADRATPRKRTH